METPYHEHWKDLVVEFVSFALETLEKKPYALEHIIDDRIDNTRNEYDQELARHGQAENWRY
jgi:hypothetical protein